MTCRCRRRLPGRGCDTGSYALETAVCGVSLFALIGLFAAFGLVVLHDGAADHAARTGARAATQAVDADVATQRARDAAAAALSEEGLSCSSREISVDASGFAAAVGEAGTVTVTVRCTVPLSQLAIPGMPGSKTLTGTFTSAIDQYTQRS